MSVPQPLPRELDEYVLQRRPLQMYIDEVDAPAVDPLHQFNYRPRRTGRVDAERAAVDGDVLGIGEGRHLSRGDRLRGDDVDARVPERPGLDLARRAHRDDA